MWLNKQKMFQLKNISLSNLLKKKYINVKKKENFGSSKPRVKSPSLTTFKSASHSMISILSRIFAILTAVSLFILVVLSPIYETYSWGTIWHAYTWHYKEIFFIFSLTGHIITHLLHKKMSKKS